MTETTLASQASRRRVTRALIAVGAAAAIVLGASAPSWAAVPTIAAVPGSSQPTIAITNATAVSGNVYTVTATATGTNTWTATVDFDVTAGAGVAPPAYINNNLNPQLTNAGFYTVLGNITSSTWRPSAGAASSTRQSGPAAWFNPHGAVAYSGTVVADQFAYTPGSSVSNSFVVNLSYNPSTSVYTITGASVGPGGTLRSYTINSSQPTFQVWTLGGLGTTGASTAKLEQVANVTFTL